MLRMNENAQMMQQWQAPEWGFYDAGMWSECFVTGLTCFHFSVKDTQYFLIYCYQAITVQVLWHVILYLYMGWRKTPTSQWQATSGPCLWDTCCRSCIQGLHTTTYLSVAYPSLLPLHTFEGWLWGWHYNRYQIAFLVSQKVDEPLQKVIYLQRAAAVVNFCSTVLPERQRCPEGSWRGQDPATEGRGKCQW